MKVSTILKCAKYKIRKPELWCKKEGQIGKKRCAYEALYAAHDPYSVESDVAYKTLAQAMGVVHVSAYNDSPRRTHSQVLRAFDRAIALAEKEEGKR